MNPIIFFANFNNLEGWVQARDSRQGQRHKQWPGEHVGPGMPSRSYTFTLHQAMQGLDRRMRH